MKALSIQVLLVCAVLLQGCVTYSNPYEPTGRIEYRGDNAHDAYAWDDGEPIVNLTVADVAYYPWWSVDYYYLGQHHYRPAYLPQPRYYLGYNFGFPVYGWPYYGYYSPIYYPYVGYSYDPWAGFPRYGIGLDYPWLDVYWARRFGTYTRAHYDPGVHVSDTRSSTVVLSRQETLTDARDRAYPSESLLDRHSNEPAATTRSVWVAPSMTEAQSTMRISNTRERKIQESRIGPAPAPSTGGARTVPSVVVPPSTQPTAPAISAPGMVRQIQPAPSFPTGPSRPPAAPPAFSQPQMIRQVVPEPSHPGSNNRKKQ